MASCFGQSITHSCTQKLQTFLGIFKTYPSSQINMDSYEKLLIKMISAQHSSNNGKNWQKLSYQKILLAW